MRTYGLMKRMAAIGLAVATAWTCSATAAQGDAMTNPRTIRAFSATGDAASSPLAAIWKKTAATQVTLQTAFAGHPSVVGTADTQKLAVQAIRTPRRLFIRLAWQDATANTAIKDTNQSLMARP